MHRKLLTTIFTLTACMSGITNAYSAESFDLQLLIEAAQEEPSITVYASTGKIVEQANGFTEKYGIKAVGVKSKSPHTIEIFNREARARNFHADVALIEDAPATIEQLLNKGDAISWVPDNMREDIPQHFQTPLVVVESPNIFTYNTGEYSSCPITNIWQLTSPEWRGKVAMQDPSMKPLYLDWFNQLAEHHDDQIKQAYQEQFNKPLEINSGSATAEFIKALAANRPLLTNSDTRAAEAVGAPDADNSFIGFVSTAAFRKNKQGLKLGICSGMEPFIGLRYPTLAVIAKGSKSPNASKLFVHYLMTADGIQAQTIDGKLSTNSNVSTPTNEASGITNYLDQLTTYNTATAPSDWLQRQDWLDLWNISYHQ